MKKVLIVDDSKFMRYVIKLNIESYYNEIEVLEASSPKEAIALYKKHKPSFVTMDLTMETSGLECIKDIIAIDKNAKIIIVSAMGQKPNILAGVKLGAVDFVIKPFTNARITEAFMKMDKK